MTRITKGLQFTNVLNVGFFKKYTKTLILKMNDLHVGILECDKRFVNSNEFFKMTF